MDLLISRLQETVDKGVPFDLEVLLDDLIKATCELKNNHKEELHQLGQSFQRTYDTKINMLKELLTNEITILKGLDVIDKQSQYRLLKKILEILSSFMTVF